jgi:4,5-dihydroxyphthalate decarboxylase
MTTAPATLEVPFEAMGAQPNFRYDWLQPFLAGRAGLEGVTIKPSGPTVMALLHDDPRFKAGEFGILDTNLGEVIPAIDAGWDYQCFPFFCKRKPVWNYVFVRADRGIETPKDLEGKTFAALPGTIVQIWTRGLLARDHGVDVSKITWLTPGPGYFPLHKEQNIRQATDRKPNPQRLLDGEVDAITGDIIDPKVWEALESSPQVKRLFPDYQERHRRLWKEHGIVTPAHIFVIGGKFAREHPGLVRQLYDAFKRSHEIALNDSLGDGTSYSEYPQMREVYRDYLKEWGDTLPFGIQANKNTIYALLDFCYDAGVTQQRLSIEQVFANEALDT